MSATFSITGRLLLCAAVLVLPSRVAVQHAHAGGDKPHTHGSGDDCGTGTEGHRHDGDNDRLDGHRHPHAHPHDRPQEPSRQAERSAEVAGISPWTAHVHVWLLGFPLTLLVMPDSGTDDDGSQPLVVSKADNQFLRARSASSDCGWLSDYCVRATLSPDARPVPPAPCLQQGEDRSSSPPLCDTARHARSGVQLI
jgi:hypothetical protein